MSDTRETLKTKDGLKIYITKAAGGEFSGSVYVEDLPESLRSRLEISSEISELVVLGDYDVEVDDPFEYMASALFNELTIYGGGSSEVILKADHEALDIRDIERQLDSCVDWSDYFANYEASRADAAYEAYRDRMSDEGDHE